MTADLPAWIPADPGTPPALPEAEGRGGRVVVMLATEGALAAGWAGTVAAELVSAWSQAGSRVVVADAGLSAPLLHEALGIPNQEGLVDALRWGASVQRVVQRPEGRRFLALTAGTAVADTRAVFALPRWKALCAGFREAGVTFALLLPASEDGLDAVLAEADGIVILAGSDEGLGGLMDGVHAPVLAVTGRDGASEPDDILGGLAFPDRAGSATEPGEGVEAEVEEAAGEPSSWGRLVDDGAPPFLDSGEDDGAPPFLDAGEDDGAPPFLDAGEEVPEPASDLADTTVGDDFLPESAPDADMDDDGWQPTVLPLAVRDEEAEFVLPDPIPVPPSLEEIVEESEAPARRSPVGLVLLLLLLLVAVAAAVAGWLGYVDIPGITPSRGTAESAPPPSVVATPAPPTEASPRQEYSLALGAYRDGVVAGERVATLAGQVPGVLFQSVPVEVDGTLYYRVLAGPAADSAAVLALASHIAEVGGIDPSSWVPRWTPLAFQLGEMPDREAADRRVGALNGLGVSAYVLAVDYSDGSVRYRVFAGAFADATEASYLSGLLDERGLSSVTLSDRIGRLPE